MANSTSTAYSNNLLVSNRPSTLLGVTGYNSSVSDQFIQIHDATVLPADTAIPTVMFQVLAGDNFSVDFGSKGRIFDNGIVICNSSTATTKTIGASDCWFDAQFI